MAVFGLRDPDCTFIHIHKTGGSSIRKGVWGKRYDKAYHGEVPEHLRDQFSFAFVRHPLDRFVSVWKMFSDGTHNHPDWKRPEDARPLSVEETFEIISDPDVIYDKRRSTFEEKIKHHAIPQTHPYNCLDAAKFVGRYERLNEDFARIAEILGIETELPHYNYTVRRSWQEEIPDRMIAPLREYYRDDFERLGYE